MIEHKKFIETLKEIKSLLGAGANIGAMNMIDKTISNYESEIEQFENWANKTSNNLNFNENVSISYDSMTNDDGTVEPTLVTGLENNNE